MSEAFDFVPPRLREEAGAEAADDAPAEQRAMAAAERYAALAASAARAAHAQARALAAAESAAEDALGGGIGHEVAREGALEEAHATLVPGLYLIESNVLHGASSPIRGPWTDLTEGAYQTLRQLDLHRRLAASPLRFGRLCALLRKLPPTGNVGGTIWAYRLGAGEIERATKAAAEVFPSSARRGCGASGSARWRACYASSVWSLSSSTNATRAPSPPSSKTAASGVRRRRGACLHMGTTSGRIGRDGFYQNGQDGLAYYTAWEKSLVYINQNI